MKIVYEDDLVTLYHGDYRFGMNMLADMHIDAIVTDPPYGGATKLKWDVWPEGWVADAADLTNALWCFGSMRMFLDRRDDFAVFKYSHEVVWEKHNGSSLRNDQFRRVHEFATLWYQGRWDELRHETPTTPDAQKRTVRQKRKPAHHQDGAGPRTYTSEEGGNRLMRSVLQVRSEQGRAIHRTQKPEGIVAPLIEYSVPVGGLVVDLFGGSGTTAIAARHLGRRAIVFEQDEDMARKAAQRLSQQAFPAITNEEKN